MLGQRAHLLESWATHPDVLAFIHAGHVLGERWGSWVDWGIVLSLSLCTAIVALIVWVRIRYPRRAARGRALALNALALILLPAVLLPFANFTVFEYAKQDNFCGSCHLAMAAYVRDMMEPQSKSLAALHFRGNFNPTQPGTACYSCHATHGVHGTMRAKLQGLSDAYHYVTGTYTTPIHLRGTFPNVLCLKCHIDSRIFRAQRIHLDKQGAVSPLIVNNTISCLMCHVSGHLLKGANG